MTDRLTQKDRERAMALPEFEVGYLAIGVQKSEVLSKTYISNS